MPRAGRFGTPSAPAAAGGGGAPSGAAGGDLAGTYPDPTIGTDKVVTAKILDKNVTLAKIADLAEALILGRAAGAGTGVPTALTATQVRTLLALATVATSGSASDLATGTLPIARIADAAVTLAKQADLAEARVLGRAAGAGTGVPVALTAAQLKDILGSGLLASLVAPSAAIANVEAVILSAVIPANSLVAGDTFVARVAGVGTTSTAPGTGTWRLRVNPTTLTGSSLTNVAPVFTASRTAKGYWVDFTVNVYTIGASGTLQGEGVALATPSTNDLFAVVPTVSASVTALTVDTTVQNLMELTFQSGASSASATAYAAFIEKKK